MSFQMDKVCVVKDALTMLMTETEAESNVVKLSNHSTLHKLSDLTDSIDTVRKKARQTETVRKDD